MNAAILNLVGQPEDDLLAYKAVLPPARSLAQMIAAFANANGGTIILGVAEKNGELIVNGLSEDFQANSVTHKAVDLLSPKPVIDYDYFNYQGKRLYIIQLKPAPETVSFEGKIYIRQGDQIALQVKFEPAPAPARTPFIEQFFLQLAATQPASTGSKGKLIGHCLGILNIVDELGKQLYPVSPNTVTTNAEGKILTRILFSSCADNFETYLTDILYEIYLANPNSLKSSQQVTVKEVLDCSDMQEFVLYWAKKKLSKLQRGSVKGFISDNQQIRSLGVIDEAEEDSIEKILQIRHLYAHRNGVVDEKFLQFYPGQFNVNDEHQLTIREMLDHLLYLALTADKLDKAAIQTYSLATL